MDAPDRTLRSVVDQVQAIFTTANEQGHMPDTYRIAVYEYINALYNLRRLYENPGVIHD